MSNATTDSPSNLRLMLDRFLQWRQVHNYSPITIKQDRNKIGHFVSWCEDRDLTDVTQITRQILERFQRHLYLHRKSDGSPITIRSQYNRILPLRAWFKWLAKQNHILFNPAADLELPKLEHTLPKHVLSAQETEAVLSQPDVSIALGLRDRAILETFYSTGMRRMELVNLNLFDLDAASSVIAVRQGKGKKDRIIPIGKRGMQWIDRYVREVRPDLATASNSDALFLTRRGDRFSDRRIGSLTHQYVKSAETGKTGSCHLFRHTMATLMLEGGADIRYIQAMLGHASVSTTQIYTRVSIKQLRKVHEETHPAKAERKLNDENGSAA